MIVCTIAEWTTASLSTYRSLKHVIRTKKGLIVQRKRCSKTIHMECIFFHFFLSPFMSLCLQSKHARDTQCAVIAMSLCWWLSTEKTFWASFRIKQNSKTTSKARRRGVVWTWIGVVCLPGSDQLLMQSDREQQPKEDVWSGTHCDNCRQFERTLKIRQIWSIRLKPQMLWAPKANVTHKSTNTQAATVSCWKPYKSQDCSFLRAGNIPDPRCHKVMI